MPKITDEQLLKKEPYSSILNLLRFCVTGAGKKYKKYWLTHGQILYALSKKPIQNNDTREYFEEIESKQFLSSKFDDLYASSPLKPPRIRRCKLLPQRLDEKLQVLIDRGWVDVAGEPRYQTYALSETFDVVVTKIHFKQEMDHWTHDSMWSFRMKHDTSYFEQSEFLICGLPTETFTEKRPIERDREFIALLQNIDKHIYKIMELKYKLMKMSKKDYYEELSQNYKSPHYLMQLNDIGFYYHASKKMIDEKG